MFILKILISVPLLIFAITFDEVTEEEFDGNTELIGWIKVLTCNEGYGTPTFTHSNITIMNQYAYSFKLQPPGGKSNSEYDNLAVIAKPGTTAMNYLNNGERMESDDATEIANEWVGSSDALARLLTPGPRNPNTPFGNPYYYWANGNGAGIHVTQGHCYWDWHTNLGVNMEMYFGFHIDEVSVEIFDDSAELIAWTKVLTCNEGYGTPTFTHSHIISLASYAYTFKLQPPGGECGSEYDNYTVITKPGTTAMGYLNSGQRMESDDTTEIADEWIGSSTALARLYTPGPRNPNTPFGNTYYYWANGNGEGIHVTTQHCYWDWHTILGVNIEMYFGFFVTTSPSSSSIVGVPSMGVWDNIFEDNFNRNNMMITAISVFLNVVLALYLLWKCGGCNNYNKQYEKVVIISDSDECNQSLK